MDKLYIGIHVLRSTFILSNLIGPLQQLFLYTFLSPSPTSHSGFTQLLHIFGMPSHMTSVTVTLNKQVHKAKAKLVQSVSLHTHTHTQKMHGIFTGIGGVWGALGTGDPVYHESLSPTTIPKLGVSYIHGDSLHWHRKCTAHGVQ